MKIGLLSDTHGDIPERLFAFFEDVDEIWHAGDIGDLATAQRLADFKPFRAVYGNIDGTELRQLYPATLRFTCEGKEIWMVHSAGYPGHYLPEIRRSFQSGTPGVLVCGHSHILRVIYDEKQRLLYLNPGAAGKFGFHTYRTAIRFILRGGEFKDMEIWKSEK